MVAVSVGSRADAGIAVDFDFELDLATAIFADCEVEFGLDTARKRVLYLFVPSQFKFEIEDALPLLISESS